MTWHQHAACIGLTPDLFFTDTAAAQREAKAVCATCPVRTECLEDELDRMTRDGATTYGVIGGTTASERTRIHRDRTRSLRSSQYGPTPRPIEHNTHRGYRAHHRRGETPCDPCKAAHAAHRQRYMPRHGTWSGYLAHAAHHARPCPECAAVLDATVMAALRATAHLEAVRLRETHTTERAAA